ncbi:MAG: serine/threonine protein kinase, partial [Acidobacteria bacterium]|nr:serine/threonine protein kinase [Acidobacteriota bacterium]
MTVAHPQKIGKYDVLSVLGEGGMGVVYKARDPFIDRIVAIKTIKLEAGFSEDNLLARLQMEARTAGRLQHP